MGIKFKKEGKQTKKKSEIFSSFVKKKPLKNVKAAKYKILLLLISVPHLAIRTLLLPRGQVQLTTH